MKRIAILFILQFLSIYGINAQVDDITPFVMPSNIKIVSSTGENVTTACFLNKNKPLIILYHDRGCKPSLHFLRALEEVYQDWKDAYDVEIIVINFHKQKKVSAEFISNYFEVYFDLEREFYDNFLMNNFSNKPQYFPRILIVNRNNELVYSRLGYSDNIRENILKEIANELIKIQ